MGVSLKKSASLLLKWNLIGQKYARAARGDWINRARGEGKCTACKIGLVMIGRYGMQRALAYATDDRLDKTLNYGPLITCPIRGCDAPPSDFRDSYYGGDSKKHPLGVIIEHLFEHHKRSVMWIDKYLAELAGEELTPA